MEWHCIESKFVKEIYGFYIFREVDRMRDDLGKFHGKARVFYAVYTEMSGDMLESFKTLRAAEKFIKEI